MHNDDALSSSQPVRTATTDADLQEAIRRVEYSALVDCNYYTLAAKREAWNTVRAAVSRSTPENSGTGGARTQADLDFIADDMYVAFFKNRRPEWGFDPLSDDTVEDFRAHVEQRLALRSRTLIDGSSTPQAHSGVAPGPYSVEAGISPSDRWRVMRIGDDIPVALVADMEIADAVAAMLNGAAHTGERGTTEPHNLSSLVVGLNERADAYARRADNTEDRAERLRWTAKQDAYRDAAIHVAELLSSPPEAQKPTLPASDVIIDGWVGTYDGIPTLSIEESEEDVLNGALGANVVPVKVVLIRASAVHVAETKQETTTDG